MKAAKVGQQVKFNVGRGKFTGSVKAVNAADKSVTVERDSDGERFTCKLEAIHPAR